jgi:hypothetical protein
MLAVFYFGCPKESNRILSIAGIVELPDQPMLRETHGRDPKDIRLISLLAHTANLGGLDIYKVELAIAVTPKINIVTLKNDHFIVTEGAYKLDDDDLCALFVHAVAHAKLGHVASENEGLGSADAPWKVRTLFAPYSEQQEREANALAPELLKRNIRFTDVRATISHALKEFERQDPSKSFQKTHIPVS